MENNDAAPMDIFDAARESGTLIEETQESTEQQGETTEAAAETTKAAEETETTTSETQVAEETTEEAAETTTAEEETTTDSDIIEIDENNETNQTTENVEETTETNTIDYSEMLDGAFEDEEDLRNYIEDLESEVEKGVKPKFANELVEKLNQHVLNGGKAEDFMKVQGVNLENMNPLDILTTEIMWSNPNISEAKARDYILNKYELDDDNPDMDDAALMIDANKASDDIKKLQTEDKPVESNGRLTQEEWEEQLSNELEEEREENIQRMEEWMQPVDDAVADLKKNGLVIPLGENKGFRYTFDGDEKYIENLTNRVDDALNNMGISVKDNPKMAKTMLEYQFKMDNFEKIVKAYGTKAANSKDEEWFKKIHNPSAIKKGDVQKQEDTLPTAEEAMNAVFGQ